MPNTQTIHIPHLGGITAAYQSAAPISKTKPTLILVNSFTTSSELYRSQFQNKKLKWAMNLVAIELLGHGQTRTEAQNWTYWDTAIMNLQVMEKLGIEKAFVLGTSQGGWICARMALLAPERILGIIPLGTSMDYESPRTRDLGCWNAPDLLGATISELTTNDSTPDFTPTDEFCDLLIDVGFGKNCETEERDFWTKAIKENYTGDDGRKRMRMATINLRDRDGLHNRVWDIRCPVLWMHGTDDAVYSISNAEEEIKLFKNSVDAKLVTVQGGQHFLSASHPAEVAENVLRFVDQHGNPHDPKLHYVM